MQNKTVLILSEVNSNTSPYTSYVHNHAVALTKLGYKVIVLAAVTIKPNVNFKKYKGTKFIDGVKVIYFKRFGVSNFLHDSSLNLNAYLYYLGSKRIIKKIIKQENIVLIDAHTFKIQGYVAAILSKKYQIKTYVTLHGTSFNRNLNTKNGRKQIKWVSKNIDSYICVSNKIYNQLDKLEIKNKKVIYDGINPENITRNNNNYNICSGGSLINLKNFDIVIKAFSKISEKYKDARLTIFGEGPKKAELQALTKELQIESKVEFVGFLKNTEVYKLLSNTNIFCLLSKPEGFGIVYSEAMYCGCITIGTKGEGIDGYIKDNENGFLIDVNSDDLAKKFDYIFTNNCDIIRKKGTNLASKSTWLENARNYMK